MVDSSRGSHQVLGQGVEKHVFPNGLTLISRVDRSLPLVSVRCYVRGGSIAESPAAGCGVAHLSEHVVATAAVEEMNRQGDGALLLALTTREYVCFHWHVLKDDLLPSLRHFLSLFSETAGLCRYISAQKELVLEEILLYLEDKARFFQQRFVEEMFRVHPMRYPVCGYLEEVERLSPTDLERYLNRIYVAPNIRIVMVGDFDPEEAVAATARSSAVLRDGRQFDLTDVGDPEERGKRIFAVDSSEAGNDCTMIGFRTVGCGSPDLFALKALAEDINHSHDNDLRKRLISSDLVHDLAARSVSTAFGAGYFFILAHHPQGAAPDLPEAVLAWLGDLSRGEVRVAPANGADDQGDMLAELGTLDLQAAFLGHGDVRVGDPLEGEVMNRGTRRVSSEDTARVASLYFTPENMTVGHLSEPN